MANRDGKVKPVHGGGGGAMQGLLSGVLAKISLNSTPGGIGLESLDDGAVIPFEGKNLVYTTDSYTISPLFFPGGDIGKLSVCGTINDLAMMGARPIALSSAYIIGAGFPVADLERIAASMDAASRETGTPIVTGDTKVIEKDIGMLINTSGIGVASKVVRDSGLVPGDRIVINGTVGDHGLSILAHREGINFDTTLESDCCPLWPLVEKFIDLDVHAMKDPTRGGIANALNEMAEKSNVSIQIDEKEIPLKEEVRAVSEILGIDPLTVANEGKVIVGIPADQAQELLERMRKHPYGKDARIIGTITEKTRYPVTLKTIVGGERILEAPEGDPVPRVC